MRRPVFTLLGKDYSPNGAHRKSRAITLICGSSTAAGCSSRSGGAISTLDKGYVICRTLTYAAAITDTNKAQVSKPTDLTMDLIRRGECVVERKGARVLVQRREGVFACVNPPAGGQCCWTVLTARRQAAGTGLQRRDCFS